MADERYSQPLNLGSSTVLITGGSSGIGLGLAKHFVQTGATVIITGRREQQLKEAAEELNSLGKNKVITHVNDVEKTADRQALYEWTTSKYPQTNILINNAGVQQREPFIPNAQSSKNPSWEDREKEIHINISGPIHLSNLFITHFRQLKTTAAIVNVSSGLGFVPLVFTPIYSATKAAIHSFTTSLRYLVAEDVKNVQVYEIVPPAVQSNLGGSHAFGEPLDEFCQSVFERLAKGEQEIGYKMSDQLRKVTSRDEQQQALVGLNEKMRPMYQGEKQ